MGQDVRVKRTHYILVYTIQRTILLKIRNLKLSEIINIK